MKEIMTVTFEIRDDGVMNYRDVSVASGANHFLNKLMGKIKSSGYNSNMNIETIYQMLNDNIHDILHSSNGIIENISFRNKSKFRGDKYYYFKIKFSVQDSDFMKYIMNEKYIELLEV